jgi:hypothetical protein
VGVITGEIYVGIAIQCDDTYMGQVQVYEFAERFKGGRTSIDDVPSELQSRVTYVEVKQKINERIWDNRRMSNGEIKSKSSVSHGKMFKNRLRSSFFFFFFFFFFIIIIGSGNVC